MLKFCIPLFLLIQLAPGQQTFTNPILDRNSADPGISRVGDFYYLTLSENGEKDLTIFKSPILTSFRDVESKVAFSVPQGYSDLWASEMHIVDGELYIYFTMQGNGKNHRMYVIKAEDPKNPMGVWGDATKLLSDWDNVAIDGTPFKQGNGKTYFVWSSSEFGPASIYIAPMVNATMVGSPKIELKRPSEPYECHDGCINEGPYFIFRNGISYCVYSVSSTWTSQYSLAMMSIKSDQDPMVVSNWVMPEGPIFSKNEEEGVYTTGHAAFTVSPDETETWMVYHGTVDTVNINGFRIARIERIDWTVDGFPMFPRPHGYNTTQIVPSGQV